MVVVAFRQGVIVGDEFVENFSPFFWTWNIPFLHIYHVCSIWAAGTSATRLRNDLSGDREKDHRALKTCQCILHDTEIRHQTPLPSLAQPTKTWWDVLSFETDMAALNDYFPSLSLENILNTQISRASPPVRPNSSRELHSIPIHSRFWPNWPDISDQQKHNPSGTRSQYSASAEWQTISCLWPAKIWRGRERIYTVFPYAHHNCRPGGRPSLDSSSSSSSRAFAGRLPTSTAARSTSARISRRLLGC